MLSEEEKKAIKEVKHFNELTKYWQEEEYEEKEIKEYITTLLNLIEKQSKEIEELKEKRFTLFDTTIKATIKINDKKWEDKIKATIEELEKQDRENRMSHNYLVIPVLQSLLEKE